MTEDQLYERIMEDVRSKRGWSEDLDSFLIAKRLKAGEVFSREFISDIFYEGKVVRGSPETGRDQLDIDDIYNWLAPEIERLRALPVVEMSSEIFRIIFRP